MKCTKCNKEISAEANFCSNCGKKAELTDMYNIVKNTQNVWFFAGIFNGVCPEAFKCIVKEMKKKSPELYYDYQQAFKFAKEQFKPIIKKMEKEIKKKNN